MSKRPSISFRNFIARIKELGFMPVRQKGSHIRFEHEDGRKTTVPDHGSKDVPVGLMNKIIRHDLDMEVDRFFDENDE
ncbi:MAG: type II toxin-antitoxin system HicA family toxin [Pirellulales bacterium]